MSSTKNIEVKSTEYPIMYSYIYEREPQDIKRLYEKFKDILPQKKIVIKSRVITGYKIENGIPVPVYKNIKPKAAPKKAALKKVAPKKAALKKVAPKKA